MSEHVESDIPARLFDRRLLRRMIGYVKPYRRGMLMALVLVVPLTLLMNYLPMLVKHAIDDYLVPTAPLDAEARLAGLAGIAGVFLGISLMVFVLRFAHGYLMSWIGQRIIFDMRADIFAKIMRLPLRYFDRNPVGRLMTRVGSDVDAMQRLLTDGLIGLATDVFTIIGIMGYMIYLSPRLAVILVVLFPLLLGILVFLNARVRSAHREVRKRQSALNAYLQEMITGMLTVQLFNRENRVRGRFAEYNGRLRAALLNSIRWFSYSFPATEILNAMTVILVLAVGGISLIRGDEALTIGILIAYLAYLRDFFRPLDDLSEKSNVLQSAMASAERVFGLMEEPEDIQDPSAPAPLEHFRGEVHLDHVWFAYHPEQWVLKDINVRIRPGESVAIVGATGAGKSSIISLVARFYDVQRGAVRVDGRDVRDYRQSDLRRRIGIVLQDPFMFSASIADNIRLFHPAISDEQVVAAAKYVNAHTFIEARPGGYGSVLRERGAGLSTGQKQLLALARAIAQDPDILLILDEATANVDTETEWLIQDALKKLMRGRTSIIIAHRLSTIRHVDRILVMRHGEVVEQGSHGELIAAGGYYKRLYDLLAHQPPGA
ncbi:MAG TPA: ABC transporter ATP-binding protein [Kiritimatiellia bacterium]|nr:ABC transporter ATP-binding protein [Kiritimatiellia bacterium]HMP00129.1 ABC transporter ATP-binding protein [Kiritimatiellia bacterium]HMP96651.1 ABC transporter ATP-binding protein [Kiritimatiellia bacterium]